MKIQRRGGDTAMGFGRRERRRALAVLVVTLVASAPLVLGRGGPPARAAATVTSIRLGGTDRYDTAAIIAKHTTFSAGSATYAVIARGDLFPDALAGADLAGAGSTPTAQKGVILLTTGDTLSTSAKNALIDMGVKGVDILGGTSAISTTVEDQLRQMGYSDTANPPTLRRIGKADRYATAQAIGETLGASAVGKIAGDPTAIVATGTNFPDGLSAGPLSYVGHFPILLTPSDSLSPSAQQGLSDLGIKHVLIAGGTVAVSANVEQQIKAMNISTSRFAGINRQDTAQQIAQFELGTLGFDRTTVDLARGDAFPDGLAGAPHAGRTNAGKGAPILLTASPDDLGSESRGYLHTNNAAITTIEAFGGTAAISDAVLADATGSATCTPPSTTTTSTPSSSTSSSSTSSSSTSSSTSSSSTTAPASSSTTGVSTSTTTKACSPPPATSSTTTGLGSTTSASPTTTSSTSSTTTVSATPAITAAGSGPGMSFDVTYNQSVTCASGAAAAFSYEQGGSSTGAQAASSCAPSTSGPTKLTLTFSPGVFAAFPGTTKLVYTQPASPTTSNAVYAGSSSSPQFAATQTWSY